MKIITSGASYLDIDAYACCIAYAELLNLQGIPARAASNAQPNASVSHTVLGWAAAFDDYPPTLDDEFVLVDVSDYHHFDPMVVLERVVEVIDHHPGYETYWAAEAWVCRRYSSDRRCGNPGFSALADGRCAAADQRAKCRFAGHRDSRQHAELQRADDHASGH